MEHIGRYRIVGELGRGAMGIVYHAVDPAIGRSVAIKTIRIREIHNTQEREKLRDRLFTEARSAGVLSHPNIVTIYDMDEIDDLAYIAMAYVNGPALEKILASEEPLSGANMVRILRQTAIALDYAHGKGIVHRDVKPANIMTDEDGSVKITDFGIAKIAAARDSQDTRTVSGTPNYMSPEQVQGLPVDGRSDQFSLAVIAYEILTGERPFPGEHLSTIVYKIVAEEPPAAQRLNGTLTESIDAVLRKALSKRPEDRYPNCSSFVGALELACAESRGWKTLAAGSAAAMPTVAVERPSTEPPAARLDDSRARLQTAPSPAKRSRMLPFLASALVVGGLAAVFAYQSGLVGGGSGQDENPVAQTAPAPSDAEPSQTDPAAETTAEQGAAGKPDPSKRVPAPPMPVDSASAEYRESPPRPSTAPDAKTQDIWVTTNPLGARAILDGNTKDSCLTPCMLHGAAGAHRLAVLQNGYLPEYQEINVSDTAVDVPAISLRKAAGVLMLTTKPAGAAIRVNGERVPQTTPAQLSLAPGSYTITVERNGESRTESVQVGESTTFLSIPLQ